MTTREKLIEISTRRTALGNPWPATVDRTDDHVTVGPFADIKDNNEGDEEGYEFIAHAPADIDFLLNLIDEHSVHKCSYCGRRVDWEQSGG
jgi:hypothetical protein